jgi:hypothetical protein
MSVNDVLADFRDRHSAKKTLERLRLDLERAVPCSVGQRPQVIFVEANGFWIMHEMPGGTPAAMHELEFLPFADISCLHFEVSDEARQADDAVALLRGGKLELSYTDRLNAASAIEVRGSDVIEHTSQAEDIERLWGLLAEIPRTIAAAGRRVVVTEGSQ